MNAFTITEMQYLVVSLICDLEWLLYLFILVDLSSVALLFAFIHKHHKLVLIETSPLCPNPDCIGTALKFEWPYKVSINSQTLSIPLNKCTRIMRMLAMGAVTAFVLR